MVLLLIFVTVYLDDQNASNYKVVLPTFLNMILCVVLQGPLEVCICPTSLNSKLCIGVDVVLIFSLKCFLLSYTIYTM